MRQLIRSLSIHGVLLLGAALFLIPLLWMASTALKPLDQTMSMPPTWIPTASYLTQENQRTEVKILQTIEEQSLLVKQTSSGETFLVSRDKVQNSQLQFESPDGTTKSVAVTVLQDIPASETAPWMWVESIPTQEQQDAQTKPRRIAVLASAIETEVKPRWDNFGKSVEAMGQFPTYLRNTLILCILTVIGTVVSSTLAAYGFSRIKWKGRNVIFLVVLATMMIPFPVVMVPLYSLFKSFGWIGTLKPLWVTTFFASAFNVFLLRQFFMTIPDDLAEAARIDGCGEFRIFWQITLPLTKPALIVVALFQFLATWNDFLGPLIYLTDQDDFTLALGLQFFQTQHGGTEWHYLMAASLLIVAPIILLFFVAQRHFIEGISMTGTKG